jgi:hypothetical protein
MRKLLTFLIALALISGVAASSFGGMMLTGVGPPPVAASAFVGPADINGAAVAWWGLRGYSAAYAAPGTNPAVDLVDQAGANLITINIKSNGDLDIASINTWVTAHSVTTVLVTKLYDQTGGGNFLKNTTLAQMPVLKLGSVTGLAANRPAMLFSSSAPTLMITNATITQAQPLSVSAVGLQTVGGDNNQFMEDNAVAAGFGWSNGAGLQISFGSSFGPAAPNNVWYSVQGLANGASSGIFVNGTLTTGNAGASGFGSTITVGRHFGSLDGYILEVGVWAGDKSANNAAMYNGTNGQKTYWGF